MVQELKSWQTASQTLIKFNQGFIGMIVKKYSWLVRASRGLESPVSMSYACGHPFVLGRAGR